MHKTDRENTAVAKPAKAAVGATVGYFDEPGGGTGTTVGKDWLNAVQDEIVNVVEDVGGLTLDKTDDGQMADCLGAVRSHATDTGAATTHRTRGLFASTSSQASGANSACIGCSGGTASGAESAVIAGAGGAAGANTAVIASDSDINASAVNSVVMAADGASDIGASATRAANVATEGCDVGTNATATNAAAIASRNVDIDASQAAVIASWAEASGDTDVEGVDSAIIASQGNTAAPTRIESAASEAAIIGCEDVEIDDGDQVLVAACIDVDVNSTQGRVAVLACPAFDVTGAATGVAALASGSDGTSTPLINGGTLSMMAASRGKLSITGARAAMIGVDAGTNLTSVSGTNTVVLASDFGTANLTISNSQSVVGGTSGGGGQTWRIESGSGDIYSDGTVGAGAADYAEMFENLEPGEIGAGLLTTRVGRKVRVAQPGDRVLGPISRTAVVVGNAPMAWRGRVKRDEWGAPVLETVEYVRWPETPGRAAYDGPAKGVRAPDDAEYYDGEPVELVRWPFVRRRTAYDGPIEWAPADRPADAEEYSPTGVAAMIRRLFGADQRFVRWPATPERKEYSGPLADAPMDPPADAVYETMVPSRVRWSAIPTRPGYDGRLDAAPFDPPEDAVYETRQERQVADEYDPQREYVPRQHRPEEWSVVALTGQVRVRVDETVSVDDWVEAGVDGVGTKLDADHADKSDPFGPRPRLECMEILAKHTKKRGYGIALCLLR